MWLGWNKYCIQPVSIWDVACHMLKCLVGIIVPCCEARVCKFWHFSPLRMAILNYIFKATSLIRLDHCLESATAHYIWQLVSFSMMSMQGSMNSPIWHNSCSCLQSTLKKAMQSNLPFKWQNVSCFEVDLSETVCLHGDWACLELHRAHAWLLQLPHLQHKVLSWLKAIFLTHERHSKQQIKTAILPSSPARPSMQRQPGQRVTHFQTVLDWTLGTHGSVSCIMLNPKNTFFKIPMARSLLWCNLQIDAVLKLTKQSSKNGFCTTQQI